MSDEASHDRKYNTFVSSIKQDSGEDSKRTSRPAQEQEHHNLWIEIPKAEHEFRVLSETKLRQKCDRMHLSHEGNKSAMIQRILEKMYPVTPDADEYEFKLIESNATFDFKANDREKIER
eukprot:CAMPEP_0202686056 /NCGR_PEP_ID=MMETSP1385-20130828/1847_1 /ASSEMBLY_ACC=CAM_ASM_000861 /TAXON_ID=933848 /ORGANISM="Elphidium margaritaceum" /LENGTH=119 /DNA_ID=CAMNT_0049340555 /DNA_START=32 /DNA_END=391 /DNA_ORIENTATION=+